MIPISLKINNFLSHTNSTLDFTRFNVALILGQYDDNPDISNGSGKSSVLSAISYALFNVGRGKKKDDMIKKGENNCLVELVFEIDGINYKIIRKRDKVIKQSSVILFQDSGDGFVNISADTNLLTDEKIAELIKFNYDVFTNSVYFKQGDIDLFVNSTPSKRKEILRSVLSLDRWEDYYKKARENHKYLQEKVSELNKQLLQVGSIDLGIVEKKNRLQEIDKETQQLEAEHASINDLLMKKESKFYAEIGNIDEKINNLKSEKDKYTTKKTNILNARSKLNKTLQENTEDLSKYQEKLNTAREKIKLKDGIELKTLEEKLLLGKTKAGVLKNKLTELEKELVLGQECIVCFNPIHEEHIPQIKERRATETQKVKVEYDDLLAKLKNATNIIQQKKNKVELANNAILEKSKIELMLNKLQNSITNTKEEIQRSEQQLLEIPTTDFDQEILQLNALINRDAFDVNKKEIDSLKTTTKGIINKKDALNVEKGVINANIIEMTNKKEAQTKLLENIHSLNHDLVVYDKLKHTFGKDGIQSVIIEGIIGELEHYTNDILGKICNEPTNVAIKLTKTNESGSTSDTFDIEVSRSGSIDDLEMLSGGEKFRVSLALRLSLSKILAKKIGGVVKFLLLDEISSSLDTKGVSVFVDVVKMLSNDFKILLISHDQTIKESFDNVIVVYKDSSGSKIVQQ